MKKAPSRRRRAPLSRDRIAQEALRIIDQAGLEAMSMRTLGTALGVEAMALYHHFPSKGHVLDAVAERLLTECAWPGPEAGPPLDRIRLGVRSYRQIAIRHPHAFALLTTRRFATARSFAVLEGLLSPYLDAGFSPAMAARLFRLAGYFAGGAGHAEIASRAEAPDATPIVMDGFSMPERFPNVTAVAPHLRLEDLDTIFEFGLAAILDATQRAPKH